MQRNQLTVFAFNGHSLNCVLDEAGNPLFRADDVCEILEFELSRAASEGATERLENLCREMSNEFFTLRQTVETLLHVDSDLRSRMDSEIQAVQTTLDAVIYKQEAVNSELHRTVKTLHHDFLLDDIRELRQLVMQSR
jgi:hypothetical protein